MAQTIQTLALNVRLSCQLLDVPESSYYERINRHPSKTQLRRQYLSLKISQLFNANRGIYGAPKIHHLLLKQGEKVGLKLVQKLMKQLQLKSVVIKKFKPGYSLSDHINRKNLIQTEPTKKNKVWSTDITYIPTQQGWAYLSTIMDRYTKKVIAWDLGKRMTVELVQRTLNKAIKSQDRKKASFLPVVLLQSSVLVQSFYLRISSILAKYQLVPSVTNVLSYTILTVYFLIFILADSFRVMLSLS